MSHKIEHWAHIFSVALLAVMLIEILLKLWVHPGEFMRSPVEVLDLVVVSLSLFIDGFLLPLAIDPMTKAHGEIIVALLLMCRIWRITRILHGIVSIVMIQREHSHKLYERIKTLEKKEGELDALQKELHRDQASAGNSGRRRG